MNPRMRSRNLINIPNSQSSVRINGVAGIIFGFFLVLASLGGPLLDYWNVSALWIILYVTLLTLIGIYILFALKIASQWEKAIVLRFGTFKG